MSGRVDERDRLAGRAGVWTQQGMSLLEMLIALLVLSFGLLGVAGLQAHSLKNNQSAYLRTQANIIAYEVIDRMRANRTVALGGGYNYQKGAILDPVSGASVTGECTGTRACTDLANWKASLEQLLPAAAGAVECNVVAAGVCRVAVEWDDTRGASSTPARIMVSTEL